MFLDYTNCFWLTDIFDGQSFRAVWVPTPTSKSKCRTLSFPIIDQIQWLGIILRNDEYQDFTGPVLKYKFLQQSFIKNKGWARRVTTPAPPFSLSKHMVPDAKIPILLCCCCFFFFKFVSVFFCFFFTLSLTDPLLVLGVWLYELTNWFSFLTITHQTSTKEYLNVKLHPFRKIYLSLWDTRTVCNWDLWSSVYPQ